MSIIMWVFFYRHFAPSLSSKVSLKCVFKLMNVAVTLTQKKNLLFWCTLIVSLKKKKKILCAVV